MFAVFYQGKACESSGLFSEVFACVLVGACAGQVCVCI
jgi:hypothetical protein